TMLIRKPGDHPVQPSEITARAVFARRREIIRAAAAAALLPAAGALAQPTRANLPKARLAGRPSPLSTDEPRTPYQDVTTYNNFYEFGTGKDDPSHEAGRLRTRP